MTFNLLARNLLSSKVLVPLALAAVVGTALLNLPLRAAENAVIIPAPAADMKAQSGLQKIVLAGGCFWGIQAVYQHTDGVKQAISGYSGGTKQSANYQQVSGDIRSPEDFLRQDFADFLFGRTQPYGSEPAGTG